MQQSKLIEVLRKLPVKDFKRLYDYLDSPFFPKSEEVIRLFKYIKPYYPNFDSPKLGKQKVFPSIFPKKEFNNLAFNNILFDGLELVEQYYIHAHLSHNNTSSYRPLLDFYVSVDLPKHFESVHKFLHQYYEKITLRNYEYWYQQWVLGNYLMQGETITYQVEEQIYHHKVVEIFDICYLIHKLEYLCTNDSLKHIYNSSVSSMSLNEPIIIFLKESKIYENVPVMKLYYHTYCMLNEDNGIEHFAILRTILPQYSNLIDKIELTNFYVYLENYCIKQYNLTKLAKYAHDLFEIYKYKVQSGIMYDIKGNISPDYFKNVIVLCDRIQEYEWATEFIKTYAEKLPENMRNDVEPYCRAILTFGQKKYSETLKLLNQAEPINIFFNLNSRRLLIRTYYEMEEYENALSALNRLRVFIHRNEILSEERKEPHRNFANFLIKLIQNDKTNKTQKLKTDIEATPNTAERKWLLEKVEEKLKVKF